MAVQNCNWLHNCLSISEQGLNPLLNHQVSFKSISISSHSTIPTRWLNLILDLNRILCLCEDWRSTSKYMFFNEYSQPHLAVVPLVVGPKAVYVRPHCLTFLQDLDKIAFISVWSSMKKSTTEAICKYLFRGISLPLLVLGQDSCSMPKCRTPHGQISSFKVPGTSKELFLKNLDNLFNEYGDRFTYANTIVVDDSPSKHL